MSWLCVCLLVTTSQHRIDALSSGARANADLPHKDPVAQRALFDAATPTSLVVRPNDSDTWVSLVVVVTGAEDPQRQAGRLGQSQKSVSTWTWTDSTAPAHWSDEGSCSME